MGYAVIPAAVVFAKHALQQKNTKAATAHAELLQAVMMMTMNAQTADGMVAQEHARKQKVMTDTATEQEHAEQHQQQWLMDTSAQEGAKQHHHQEIIATQQ